MGGFPSVGVGVGVFRYSCPRGLGILLFGSLTLRSMHRDVFKRMAITDESVWSVKKLLY